MQWLWLLLAYLFPRDPVRQMVEAARQIVANLAEGFQHPETLEALAEDAAYRAHVEGIAKDYEATVHLAIAARACAIAGVRFRPVARPFHTPARPQSLAHLIKRIHALVALCDDIERLAQLRAIQLRREHENDPLCGLAAHGSTDAALRAAAHHELVGVAGILKAQIALMVSSAAMAARPSNHARVLTAVPARAPPVFDVCHLPQAASEAPLLRSPALVPAHAA
ncbi:MAG: hypothetical protein B7Y90_06880 [Alphaproteobacteria bacterium 32-64-14]|nr:MAG: hypothetical protein B7Y90_06880 [Alphaproteobacteria bacterium 32-64-14]